MPPLYRIMKVSLTRRIVFVLIILSVLFVSTNWPTFSAPPPGLSQGVPIGKFLNENLPNMTPSNGSGPVNWSIVPAFPALTFLSPLTINMHPRQNLMFVGSRDGLIEYFVPESNVMTKSTFLDLRSMTSVVWDGGFLGMAFHPDFGDPSSPYRNYFYVFYCAKGPNGEDGAPGFDGFPCPQNSRWIYEGTSGTYLRLSRFEVLDGTLTVDPDPTKQLKMVNIRLFNGTHRGGGLVFGDDGYLYLTIGDQAQYLGSQNIIDNFEGGTIRIDVNVHESSTASIAPKRKMGIDAGYADESTGLGYLIPPDNPWVNSDPTNKDVFEEFWTTGHRAPHRLTKDRLTGDLWSGEIGHGSREEINVIKKGGNYEWPKKEGTFVGTLGNTCGINNLPYGPGTLTPPVVDFERSNANAIIGGYVYRGNLFNSIIGGKYICADYGSNNIFVITPNYDSNGNVIGGSKEILSTPFTPTKIITFGEDHNGELYMGKQSPSSNGALQPVPLYTLSVTGLGDPAPQYLSQTGAFKNLITLEPEEGIIPYEMIEPFWSDGADKYRWIAIPNDGVHNDLSEQIMFSENDNWMFPNGTVAIKHFELGGKRLETRFEVKGDDGQYYYLDYKWNNEGTDAELQSTGITETININGEDITWRFPSTSECLTCHQNQAGSVIGLKTRNLNCEITYPQTGIKANQLVSLSNVGILDKTILESDTKNFLTAAAKDDLSKPLEYRARTYLDVNCGYCHQPVTQNRGLFDMRLTTALDQQLLINGLVGQTFGITNAFAVVPQDTGKSIVHYRMNSVDPIETMPPIGKNKVDRAGVNLITEWINSLAPVAPPTPEPGLVGNYFDNDGGNDKFQMLKFEQIDANINYNWGTGSPNQPEVGNDDFAMRWIGLVTPDYSETYTFYTNSDDGVRLWINGNQIIDNWTNHPPTINTGTIALTAGQPVSIELEFYERGGGAVIELEWSSNSQTRQIIPASKFSHYPMVNPTLCTSNQPNTILSANFDADTEGFTYIDDPFRGTTQPNYASGNRTTNNGINGSGGLEVLLGGVDQNPVNNMSGGWNYDFNLSEQSDLMITFQYNLIQDAGYEDDEYSQVMMSFDGTLYGTNGNDYIAQITGDGNGGSNLTTGWQTFTLNLNQIAAGDHSLTIGAFNNKKTWDTEVTTFRIDDVQVLNSEIVDSNPPVAVFSTNSTLGGYPLTVTFDADISYDLDNDALTYSWDFGDGNNGTGMTPSHTYTVAGNYSATLTVTDVNNCSDEESISIIVHPSQSPVAGLTAYPVTGNAPLVVVFEGSTSTDPENDALTFEWDFNDGVTRSGASPKTTHTFNYPGTYEVLLKVSDDYSSSFISETITVNSHTSDLGIFTKNEDVGDVNASGLANHTAGVYTVTGSGADIGSSEDEMHFIHRPHSGDLEFIAEVISVENTSPNARVTMMARSSTVDNAPFFAVEHFSDQKVRTIYRDANGVSTSDLQDNAASIRYLRLVRSGDYFIGYYSTQSAIGPWIQLGITSIPMQEEIFIGFGVTAANDGQTCTATLEEVSINGFSIVKSTLVKAKINLQGPWNGTDMNTVLFDQNRVPLSQPYVGESWGFFGTESILAYPALASGQGLVDWVILQIHDPVNPDCVVAQRACFVRNDGWLVDLEGTEYIDFGVTNLKKGYISIKHRNHLGVMTENAIDF